MPLPLLRTHVVPHAIATVPKDSAIAMLAASLPQFEDVIFADVPVPGGGGLPAGAAAPPLDRIEHSGTEEEAVDLFRSRGWLDGLPIVLPTEERVERMLGALAPRRGHVLGAVPPSGTSLSLESLAVNAVMAGCRPEYFPVVIGAARAVLDPRANLLGVNTTTNAVSPLLIAGGPIAERLGIHGGLDVLGSYHRPNITIGRTVRLVMIGVGDCRPGDGDMATQGQGMKVGMCMTESPESPWEPLHVELGCRPDENAVTTVAVTAQFNVLDFGSRRAPDLLNTFARTIAVPGLQNVQIGAGPLLLLGLEHARMLAAGGFSKDDVKRWLFEHARVPLDAFGDDVVKDILTPRRERWVSTASNPSGMVPVADDWRDFTILVAGGQGSHSVLMPTFLGPSPVMVRIGNDGLGPG